MLKYIIEGGNKLNGEVKISGSKNASLPILAASILNPNPVTFYNIPDIEDVNTTLKILKILGCKVVKKCGKITISCKKINRCEIPRDLMNKSRSTVILAGAIIGRLGQVTFSNPGGCNIGKRPIDLHLNAFKKMGITVVEGKSDIKCYALTKIHGIKIKLRFPSVGATENIILASVYSNGTTCIYNAAKEPEIVDLANCLNQMGANIKGAGTSRVIIRGVNKLHSCSYTVMPDRIETGTFLCMCVATNGRLHLKNTNAKNIVSIILKLREMGAKISIKNDEIYINANNMFNSTNIVTRPYPGFPTDMQPIFASLLTKANGKSKIEETIFENRFGFCDELKKMNANIIKDGNTIEITGVKNLKPCKVTCLDLRAGAALVLACLSTNGVSEIDNVEHILRGYEKFDEKLNSINANVKLIND